MAERTNLATRRSADDNDERSAHEIRQDIAAKRETISDTVDRLGERIHQTLDWREYVAQYPAVALGLAAGIGFLISGIFKRTPTPQERILDAVADITEDITDRVASVAGNVIKRKMISGRTVTAAITAAAAKAAIDFAKEKARAAFVDDKSQRVYEQPIPEREPLSAGIQTSPSSTSNY